MTNITRREFVAAGLAGVAAIAGKKIPVNPGIGTEEIYKLDKVTLGKTGIKVSRLAIGTGTRSWDRVSDQTRMGEEKFVDVLKYAFEACCNHYILV